MLQVFKESEKIKTNILGELDRKLNQPTKIRPSKQTKLSAASVEHLMKSLADRQQVQIKDPTDWVKPRIDKPAAKKEKKERVEDPIRNIMRVNDKCFKFQIKMNNLLKKILNRYELDKPILMRDKLDIIWDKKKEVREVAPKTDPSSEEEFEKVLKSIAVVGQIIEKTGDEKQRTSVEKQKKRKTAKEEDNGNHYAVKFKLGQRKMFRTKMNTKQVSVYNQLLKLIESRRVPVQSIASRSGQAYMRPQEIEREFLDAFAVILESGYFLAETDFFDLVGILDV